MRSLPLALVLCSAISAGAAAKTFPLGKGNFHDLRNADSVDLECKNQANGVIDSEFIDVDNGTVTVKIPDHDPVVHRITSFSLTGGAVQDRFGGTQLEVHLQLANWGMIGNSNVGLFVSGYRWHSHHEDGSWWDCAL